jgi:hydrogenase expression/formation protein HypE
MTHITMAHGAGGSYMQTLIKDYIVKYFGGSSAEVPLEALDDSAVIDDIVLKSDSHTIKPLFFPGGDIGRLAIAGTVNDIAVLGAEPIGLTSAFVIEDGFPLDSFERIVRSMRDTCRESGVYILTGDTKVMERGALDKLIVNTSGIGRRSPALASNLQEVNKFRPMSSRWLLDSNLQPGDKIIVSGSMGDHGIALLAFREGYDFGSTIVSDVAPLNKLIHQLLQIGGLVAMKDPTRSGLANTLNEWKDKSNVGLLIEEQAIPIKEGVRAACEMLGIDPLDIGNEGKLVIGVVPEKAEAILQCLQTFPEGQDAAIIGKVTDQYTHVILETVIGGRRILPSPLGDPIPRIC